MSVLSKNNIVEAIEEKKLVFEPGLDQFQLQPIAVDLRVGTNFFIPRLSELTSEGRAKLNIDHLDDSNKSEILEQIHLEPGQIFELLPGEFVLISSLEKISINSGDIFANLYSRSSTSRRGILIESGVIEPYFSGHLTIPVFNQTRTHTIKIYPGERIAQLIFHELKTSITKEESLSHGLNRPKYQGSKSYMLDYKFDPHDEIQIIKNGEMEKLKKKFGLKLVEEEVSEEKAVPKIRKRRTKSS